MIKWYVVRFISATATGPATAIKCPLEDFIKVIKEQPEDYFWDNWSSIQEQEDRKNQVLEMLKTPEFYESIIVIINPFQLFMLFSINRVEENE